MFICTHIGLKDVRAKTIRHLEFGWKADFLEILFSLLFKQSERHTPQNKTQIMRCGQRENRVLMNIYYSPQNKSSISLEVRLETKLYPDSGLGNSLCTSECKPKSEKKTLFSWPPMSLEIVLLAGGDPTGSQVCPRTLKRFRSTPSQWNGPLFLRQTKLLYFCK